MDSRGATATVPVALGAAVIGAATMYYTDPHGGRRRRALLRDQAAHAARRLKRAARAAMRGARDRARGLAIEGTARIASRLACVPVADDVLVRRIRAELGHVVRHPRSVEVTVEEGRVALSGFVEVDEVERLLRRVRALPGVVAVENRLCAYAPPGQSAALGVG
jgi:osmotically-inducible protein OsmY